MASDGLPIQPSGAQSLQGSKPAAATTGHASSKSLPVESPSAAAPSGVKPAETNAAKPAQKPAGKAPPNLQTLVARFNKRQQNSGRLNQYILNTSAGRSVIQEINPDTKQVVSELPANEFRALAQALGISGLLVDTHA